ncbi:hypothetical protein P9875_16380 [Janthinobacterium rivuli]|uniref:Uncharacterized protein n=1 Tax=Janthinobacterium rivuli TaxID=2751478 RepID=A0ABY8HXG7_9BURK|nr:hypothetical protein [Janthinobacterium rivuli]WFR77299.1 hypothetical protein P9875_16380 [Janthinobacterium rivuli]
MRAIAGLLLCLCAAAVQAQEETVQAVEPAGQEAAASVNVKGIRDPDWKPYSAMLKGVKRFEEKHVLAPGAQLRFILEPRRAEVDMHAIALRLESDEAGMAIPLGERNIFSLPVEQGPLYEKAELSVNRKAGSIRWIPYVRSAATSDTIRRLGDLRLACEVHWAIDKDTLPFAMRTAMGALGGPCNFVSQKGTYSFSEPRRITAATISDNGKSAPVPFSGSSFTPPLREQDWSDDSVVELTFDDTQTAR